MEIYDAQPYKDRDDFLGNTPPARTHASLLGPYNISTHPLFLILSTHPINPPSLYHPIKPSDHHTFHPTISTYTPYRHPLGMIVLRGPDLVEFLSPKHKDKTKVALVRDAEGYQEFKLQTSRFFNDKDNQNVRGSVSVRGKAEDLQPGLMGNLLKVTQQTLSIHLLNTPSQSTLSMRPVIKPYQYTLSSHPVNAPSQCTFSEHPVNAPT